METFVLVEITPMQPNTVGGPAMKGVIRTYASKQRADEDFELMEETSPEKVFVIITAPHIDR